jgi:hypothetical protein
MSKTDTTIALSVVTAPELVCAADDLARLQIATVEQFRVIGRMRGEEALRSLIAGLMLHRIKASLPYGEFGKWTKRNLQQFGDRWVNYLMRLALIFVQASKITKPLMLAMPGDQTELALDSMQGQQRAFYERAMKFVGRHSISELLDKHGIKETGKLGGKRAAAGGGKPGPIDPDQLYLQARDEIGLTLSQAETLLLKENRLQHLAGHPEEIRGVVAALRELANKVEAAAKPILKTKG